MTEPEIEAALRSYLRDNYLPRQATDTLEGTDNLFDHGILDSAGLISFIVYLEKEFGLRIPDEELLPDNFSSLAAIAGYIARKKGSPSP